jgi:membrane-associated phospholipid phosphatase
MVRVKSSCSSADTHRQRGALAIARCLRLSILGALLAAPGGAQLADGSYQRPLFTWRDAVLAGGFAIGTFAIRPLDKSAALSLQRPYTQQQKVLRTTATIVRTIAEPGSVFIGVSMYAVGRVSHSDQLAELGLRGTEALVVGGGFANILKYSFGRARPFVDTVSPNPDDWQLLRGRRGDSYRSFPSGHTVAAFAAAAAVSAETSRWWPGATYYAIGPALYAGAAAVGASRMYENRHWASDVIVGAAIGTFAGTKVVRYHRTHPTNQLDRWLLRASVSPSNPSHVSFMLFPGGMSGR